MLLALDATTKSIVAFGGNANATNISFVAVYADSSGTAFTEGVSDGILQGSTYVTIVAAPAAGVRRIIKSITLYNNHSAGISVAIELDNNGTKRKIAQLLLGSQQTWSSDDLGSAGTFKLVNDSTPIEGGTSGSVLYNNNGIVSHIARTGTSTLVSSVSPTIATPTLITPSVQDSIASTSLGFNLINTTATTVNFAGAAQTLNIGGAASSTTSLSAGSGSVVNLGGGANAAELRFLEPSGSGTNYTALKAQAQSANVTYTLPAADGSNGQVLATNGSGVLSWAAGGTGGGGAAFKNVLHNGDFRITQRGAGPFTSASTPTEFRNNDDTYQLDRWILLSDGNDIVDVSQSTTSPATGRLYSLALDVETINKKFGIAQIIERNDCQHMIGGTVSLSFKARVSSTTKLDKLRAAVVAWNGTADTVTSDIVSAWNAEDTNPTLITNCQYQNTPATLSVSNTSWNTYTINNISVASTFNSLDVKNLIVFIWSDVTDTTLGDFLYITDVQLEAAAAATDYEYIPEFIQLYRCQRFVHALGQAFGSQPPAITEGQIPICNGVARAADVGFGFLIIRPYLRAVYFTVVFNAIADFHMYFSDNKQVSLSSLSYIRPGEGGLLLGLQKAAGTTAMTGGEPLALLTNTYNARMWIIADM
jgi:hypothetical protein